MDSARVDHLFSAFQPVEARRMFGAAGLYASGVMFGILKGDDVYLKADDAFAAEFKRAGCEPFAYERGGRRIALSFWRLPQRLYDEPDELAEWAEKALVCACKAAAKKTPGGRTSKKPQRRLR